VREQFLGCIDEEVVSDGLDEVESSIEGEEEYVISNEGEGVGLELQPVVPGIF